MITKHFRYGLIALAILAVQTTIIKFISIEDIVPDFLVLWIVYLALKEGQLPATIWGFFIGMMIDFTTGSVIGLAMLSKTICGFIAGYFNDGSRMKLILGSYRFLLIVFAASIVHNIIYFIVFTRGTDISLLRSVLQYGVTTTLYTTLAALFPVMIIARKSVTVNVE